MGCLARNKVHAWIHIESASNCLCIFICEKLATKCHDIGMPVTISTTKRIIYTRLLHNNVHLNVTCLNIFQVHTVPGR
jgi:hypothetical protein